MTPAAPEILESMRPPALDAAVLRYAGVPAPPESSTDHFTQLVGPEPHEACWRRLLEEAAARRRGRGRREWRRIWEPQRRSRLQLVALPVRGRRPSARRGPTARPVYQLAVELPAISEGLLRSTTRAAVPGGRAARDRGVSARGRVRLDVDGEPARPCEYPTDRTHG